jgi:antibiotic biosynthesis monooxygenase (ABM) superfamily enzyme
VPLGESVGVVVTRRVPPSEWAAFEAGLRELVRVASRQPGHLSAEVLRGPAGPGGREYHIVYRFADEASLRAWDASPERRTLLSRIEPLAADAGRRELTGLEAWFDLPPGLPPPSRHRMAILTWLGIWPLVSLVFWLVAPRLGTLPFLVRTALTTSLLVLAMTYLVMPWLARLAAPWLQPGAR